MGKLNAKETFTGTSINVIGETVCPKLKYNKQTVQHIAHKIISDITPVASYIKVTHESDTSVKWETLQEIDSYRELRDTKTTIL